eukprot:6175987-Pleurochrysis_carterae.AAC.4
MHMYNATSVYISSIQGSEFKVQTQLGGSTYPCIKVRASSSGVVQRDHAILRALECLHLVLQRTRHSGHLGSAWPVSGVTC